MITAINASEIKVNDILAFTYAGKPRVCVVLTVSDTWMRCELTDGGFRCFSFDKIEGNIEHATNLHA